MIQVLKREIRNLSLICSTDIPVLFTQKVTKWGSVNTLLAENLLGLEDNRENYRHQWEH